MVIPGRAEQSRALCPVTASPVGCSGVTGRYSPAGGCPLERGPSLQLDVDLKREIFEQELLKRISYKMSLFHCCL